MKMFEIFNNATFGALRVHENTDGILMFCGADVATALGYGKPRNAIARHCKNKVTVAVPGELLGPGNQTRNVTREMVFISEGDVMRLIVKSKLPEAEAFEAWVFDELLPTIRNTGGYVYDEDAFINAYLPNVEDATKDMFRGILKAVKEQNALIAKKEHQLERQKPAVEFMNAVHASDTLVSIGDFAKVMAGSGLKIGRNRLFAWLREEHILQASNVPYQTYVNQGYFKVRTEVFQLSVAGAEHLSNTTYLTGKGQDWLCKKLRREYTRKKFG